MKKKTKKKAKKTKLTTSKICCTECGTCKGMSKDRRKKLVATFGSLEELHAKYVCRTCRKALNVRKDGKKKPEKRKRKANPLAKYKVGEGEYVLPTWMKNIAGRRETHPATPEELKAIGTCWRPDIWTGNKKKFKEKCCNGCPSIEIGSCGCKQKFAKVK